MKDFYSAVYHIVSQIPYGKVTSYGHIALLTGKPQAARAVGYALRRIPLENHNNIPWHRVINVKARISIRNLPYADVLQKQLLEKEGVIFNEKGETDFSLFGWFPV